jgi:hypothetical protein
VQALLQKIFDVVIDDDNRQGHGNKDSRLAFPTEGLGSHLFTFAFQNSLQQQWLY